MKRTIVVGILGGVVGLMALACFITALVTFDRGSAVRVRIDQVFGIVNLPLDWLTRNAPASEVQNVYRVIAELSCWWSLLGAGAALAGRSILVLIKGSYRKRAKRE